MVLIVALSHRAGGMATPDPHCIALAAELKKTGVRHLLLQIGSGSADFKWSLDTGRLSVKTHSETHQRQAIKLSEISCVFWRFPSFFDAPLSDEEWQSREAAGSLWSVLCTRRSIVWVNPPTADGRCASKISQLLAARQSGFVVPDTWLWNDMKPPSTVPKIGSLVVKPLWAPFVVERGRRRAIFSERVPAARAREERLAYVQSVVPGHDIRITQVGSSSFAAIYSQSNELRKEIDVRKNMEPSRWHSFALDEGDRRKCRNLLSLMGLRYAAFDFILSKGKLVFLECNPSPIYWGLEKTTGMKITAALARILAKSREP